MSEGEQNTGSRLTNASGYAKVLFGKVASHRIFSEVALLWVLLGLTFLLPIFFIPGQFIAPEFAKIILLEGLVLVSLFLWASRRLHEGTLAVPKSLLLLVSLLLIVQFVVAAIASPTPFISFLGSGYDMGTVSSFVVLALLMFLSSLVFTSRDRVLMLYTAFLSSGALIMLYQLLRLIFGEGFLDFGIFTSAVSSPVGRWNDAASLMGGMLLLVLVTLYFFPQNKKFRIPSLIIFLFGLYFLVSVNFTSLWLILGALLLVLVSFSVYEGEKTHRKLAREARETGAEYKARRAHMRLAGHLPLLATILLLVSILYGSGLANITWGKDNVTVAGLVAKTIHAGTYSEVVLTPQFTYDIVKSTIAESPLTGTGPNRFASAYLKYKMSAINRTPFWDATFDFGLGRIPTYFGTTGIIGTVLWILFIVLLLVKSRKVFALFSKDRVAAYIGFSLFLLSLYFWGLAVFYLPNITIFSLAFIFTGALLAFFVSEGVLGRLEIGFGNGSRWSFVLTPVFVVLLVGVVASGVLLYRQVSSLVLYQAAQKSSAANNIAEAEEYLVKANALSERDLYHRGLSNLALLKLQALAQQNLSPEQVTAQAKQLIDDSRAHAETALRLDPTNFENYLQMGGVFDALGNLGIQNTTQFAKDNYEKALVLNPKSPRVLFMLAHIEFVGGDKAKTKEYLYRALAERPNFPEALSFIVQLELQDKNATAAINAVSAGVQAEPTSFLLHFALGYLYYLNGDVNSAIPQFEAAVFLNPPYADAKYFLGLSYDRVGRTQEAIQQFTDVQTLNPDNKDIGVIIRNLKAGNKPFAGLNETSAEDTTKVINELKK